MEWKVGDRVELLGEPEVLGTVTALGAYQGPDDWFSVEWDDQEGVVRERWVYVRKVEG